MASSSSQSGQRRKPLKKRQPTARSNYSLFGTIKNLVTAPLAWFASTDDFEDSKDLKGKRRRLVAAPTEPDVEDDGRVARNKRMRMYSPPRDHQQPPSGDAYGYLDPPVSAFQQNFRPSTFGHQTVTPSPATSTPGMSPEAYDFSHNNHNLIRTTTLTRTMSIDPPSRPVSRSSAFASIPTSLNRDTSLDSSMMSIRRDLSMPPLSNRPSFRMRTSMTPVPSAPREISEPPPLKTLVSNPVFIRGPPVNTYQRALSRQPSVTLGTLVESVRSARSPSRQHSSLLFGTSAEPDAPLQESPAEKALHELDIYKTPLVPTRLRSSNALIPASNPSSVDLFKSRRGSQLVLMQDEKRVSRLGRRNNGKREAPLTNETKPYAGEGGMKKLLARRKLEVEEAQDKEEDQKAGHAEDTMDDGELESNKVTGKSDELVSPPPPPPPPSKPDWFSIASSSSMSTAPSSLRVGRTKIRSHISRPPARPMKTKFSAAYDDDDAMDEGEGDNNQERKKERELLEEAAKRAPVFEIPKDFTFAKTMPHIEHDAANAKEPPMVSLPFSFAKPTPTSPGVPPRAPPFSSLDRTETNATQSQPREPVKSSPPGNNRLPNFFANSSAFAKPLDIPKPLPLTFPVFQGATTQPEPAKDVEKPLWAGDIGSKSVDKVIEGFGSKQETMPSAALPVTFGKSDTSIFASAALDSPPVPDPAVPFPPSSSSLFSSDVKKDDKSSSVQAALLGAPSKPGFLFSEPFSEETGKPPSILSSTGLSMSTSSLVPNSPKSSNLLGNDPSKVVGPAAFSFGQPTISVPTIATPKPLFGGINSSNEPSSATFGTGDFIFGNKATAPKSTGSPFTLNPTPSTPPPIEAKKTEVFSFSPAAPPSAPLAVVAAPTPAPFSFGASSANTASTKHLSFGTPGVMSPIDRPSTPPKNQDQECSMEESPTRDMQQVNGAKSNDRPTLGFAFGTNASTSIFGGQVSSSAPFSFGSQSSAASNPFAKESKPEESKPFGGFGQGPPTPSIPTPFSFGQSKAPESIQASTSAPFSFGGSAPSSAVGPGPTFAFGGPTNNSTGPVFNSQPTPSAPSSPSTFNQSSPFSFTTPLPQTGHPFTFGSQPASPAGAPISLPQPTTPVSFGGSAGFGQQSASPFGAPSTTAPAPAGGTLFTIGAPPSAPGAAGARQIKKMPTRRTGAKR